MRLSWMIKSKAGSSFIRKLYNVFRALRAGRRMYIAKRGKGHRRGIDKHVFFAKSLEQAQKRFTGWKVHKSF